MSSGFSVGDFLAALKIMSEAVSSLENAHGAASEYQALRRSLNCVSLAVKQTSRLSGPGAESVKAAAFAWQCPLEDFLKPTHKYEKSLDMGRSSGFWLKNSVRKIDWALTKKDDVRKLKEDLNLHLECVNMLFVGYGLEKLLRRESENASEVCNRLEQTSNAITAMGVDLEAQAVIVRENHSRLGQLMTIASNELAKPIKSIFAKVSELFTVTEQVRTDVRDLRESVLQVDAQFTWFQAPVKFEDALGQVYPIPSEFSSGVLEAIIKGIFEGVPESSYIARGQYVVYHTRTSSEFLSGAKNSQLLPGMQLTMAILIEAVHIGKHKRDNSCPIMSCESWDIVTTHGGGWRW